MALRARLLFVWRRLQYPPGIALHWFGEGKGGRRSIPLYYPAPHRDNEKLHDRDAALHSLHPSLHLKESYQIGTQKDPDVMMHNLYELTPWAIIKKAKTIKWIAFDKPSIMNLDKLKTTWGWMEAVINSNVV